MIICSGDFTIIIETTQYAAILCDDNVNENQDIQIFEQVDRDDLTVDFVIGNGLKSNAPLHIFYTHFNTTDGNSSMYPQ
jgi:hypothetical protein